MSKRIIIGWIYLTSLAVCSTATTLTLAPANGSLSGSAGSTVGWGFTISNSSDFLVVTGSDFCVGVISSPCSNGLGAYSDFIGTSQFVVVGPSPESPSITQGFNAVNQTGVGSFAINSNATVGNSVAGQIVVDYDLFSVSPNDPTFNPTVDTISTGNMLTANASITVTAGSATPEPATGAIMLVGILAVIGLKQGRGKTLSKLI